LFCSISQFSLAQDFSQIINIEKTQTGSSAEILQYLLNNHSLPLIFSASSLPSRFMTIQAGKYSLKDLLKQLQDYGIGYETRNGMVVLLYQNPRKTVSGKVTDAQTGEALIGATISFQSRSQGVPTNNYGFYSIHHPQGEVVFTVDYLGYKSLTDTVQLYENTVKHYALLPDTSRLASLTIYSADARHHIRGMVPAMHQFDYLNKGEIPYFLGEVDIFQEALLLPGIKTLGEDASGLNIRGGNIDQNLILLDEAIIYNPNHFYGLISVFNPEAVNKVQIMRGFIPPSYGGRISSVMTIHQKEGNSQEFRMAGGIGLVSARLMAEGPIKKDKSSFLISGRQSLLDLTLDNAANFFERNSRTQFQDINLKFNWRPSDKNTFYLSGYFGNDRNRAGFDAIRNWGNRTMTARWNHTFNQQWFSNLSLVISDYSYRISNPVAPSFIERSEIINYKLKYDHNYYFKPSSQINFGTELIYHTLKPGERLPVDQEPTPDNSFLLDVEHGLEYGAYISHQTNLNDQFELLYGIRLSGMMSFGPDQVFQYQPNLPRSESSISDTLNYGTGEIIQNFTAIEPRIAMNLKTGENSSLKLAYNRINQYLQLVSNTAIPAPTDIWKLSDQYFPPLISDNFSLGFYQNIFDNKFQLTSEVFYRVFNNMVDYRNGADLLFNPNPEMEILTGSGRSYGWEFLLEKKVGRWKGWLSYTLSRNERKFTGNEVQPGINNGSYFPANNDKPHDLSLVGIYQYNPRISFSMSFNYSTGRPFTFPVGKYRYEDFLIPHFEQRNQNRLSDYHRLDLAMKLQGRAVRKNGKSRKIQDYWTFSIFNVYGRRNAYTYIFRESADRPGETEVVRFSIFGSIIPSVTYNFKF
jgi:hypothetical protein